ncbi:MAG: hypothetical protein ACKOGP_06910, partial [Bacteroidota bacterium]
EHPITPTEPPQVVEFASSTSSLNEGTLGTVAFNVALPAGVVSPTLSFGGTASPTSDYTYDFVTNSSGDVTGISISPTADSLYDPDETIIITLQDVSNASLGARKTHTLTLKEDPLSVAFVSTSSSILEGGASSVTYNIPLPDGVIPSISFSGTASKNSDYTYTIDQSGIYITTLNDNNTYDPNETIIITITSVSGNAVPGSNASHTITITETPLTIEFVTPSTSSISEGSSFTIDYNISLPNGVTPSISFGGTASPTSDYTYSLAPSGISIVTRNDNLYDPNETIIITLTGVSDVYNHATPGNNTTLTITLTEPPLVVGFNSSASNLAEGNSSNVAYNIPSLPSGVTPSISLYGTATQGTDYTYTITQTGINITAIGNDNYDPNETIILTITGVSGNAVTGTVVEHTITLTEPPLVVEFASSTSSLNEGTSGTVAFNVALPAGVVSPTLSFGGTAVEGDDYTYQLTSIGILVTVLDEGVTEPNETLIITITGVSDGVSLGTVLTHTATLKDNIPTIEFAFPSSTLIESNSGVVTYNIILPQGVDTNLSFGGTATLGTDYTFIKTSTGISISTLTDGTTDPNETIIISLISISGNAV